jgi:hypothetical protein
MADLVVWIQTGAAVLTALSALGIFGLGWRVYKTLQVHDRVLFGEDEVQGWDGIVPVVRGNRDDLEQLKEECSDYAAD